MHNLVHLVMAPKVEVGICDALGDADRRYTRTVNVREDWKGHLWQERCHTFAMDERYLLAAVRYTERNPLGASLCVEPQDWPWSSAAAHVAAGNDAPFAVGPLLESVADWEAFVGEADDETHNVPQRAQPAPDIRSVPTHSSNPRRHASPAR